MELNFNDKEFEKFIQKELNSVEPSSADDTWAQIAARQKKPNIWLKTRYYGTYAIPALAIILATVFVLKHYQGSENGASALTTAPIHSQDSSSSAVIPNSALPNEIAQPVTQPQPIHIEMAPKMASNAKLPQWYRANKALMAQIRFEATQGVEYRNPESGNVVTIAANTLVYSDGSPVKGAVDMYFREYRTIPDMLAANIPMHYNDPRGNYFFNSGGMFDVRVSQNGKELFMAAGEAYQVDFTANENLSKASLFYLDEGKNNWEYLSDQPFASNEKARPFSVNTFDARSLKGDEQGTLPPVSTETEVVRQNTNLTCLPEIPRYTNLQQAIAQVKEAIPLGVDLASGKRSFPRWYCKNPEGTDEYFTYSMDRSEIKLIFANDKEVRFFPQDINGIYTELEAFKNCYFVRTGDTLPQSQSISTVDQIFNTTNIWRSCTVLYDGTSANCRVTLGTENQGFIRISAKLVRTSESGISEAFDAAAIFKKYDTLREKRLDGMLSELQQLRRFTETSKMFREETEFCFTKKEWLQYFETNLPMMRARYSRLLQKGMATNDPLIEKAVLDWTADARTKGLAFADQVAARLSQGKQLSAVLSLVGFGTYNCDQIFMMTKTPMFAAAKFVNTAGTAIAAATLRVLDKSTKIFLSFNSPAKICVLPGRDMEVLVTDINGRIYHFPGVEYQKMTDKEKGIYTLKMNDVTDTVQSPSGWANLLGI